MRLTHALALLCLIACDSPDSSGGADAAGPQDPNGDPNVQPQDPNGDPDPNVEPVPAPDDPQPPGSDDPQPPGSNDPQPPGSRFRPWYEHLPALARSARTYVWGHWARRGLVEEPGLRGLDTGCVWGGRLTAWVAEEDRIVSVHAARAYATYRA